MHRFKPSILFLVLILASCNSDYSSFSEIEGELKQIVKLLENESNLSSITKLYESGIREVNDEDIVKDSTQIDSLQSTYGDLVTQNDYLSRNGIDLKIYSKATSIIDSSEIFKVEITDKYIAFHMGGFIDSYEGYLYLKQGHKLHEEKDYIFGAPLLRLTQIKGEENWNQFVSD